MSVSGTVGDHATSLADYPHVRDGATLRDVFATLKENYDSAEQFRSVLMLDGDGRLLGMLGLRDLLHALLPDYLHSAPTHFQGAGDSVAALALLWQEDCSDHCRKAGARLARAHLTPVGATLAPDDPLAKAVYLFASIPVNVLPIIDGGRVVGVLRLVDVLAQVAQAVLADGDAA